MIYVKLTNNDVTYRNTTTALFSLERHEEAFCIDTIGCNKWNCKNCLVTSYGEVITKVRDKFIIKKGKLCEEEESIITIDNILIATRINHTIDNNEMKQNHFDSRRRIIFDLSDPSVLYGCRIVTERQVAECRHIYLWEIIKTFYVDSETSLIYFITSKNRFYYCSYTYDLILEICTTPTRMKMNKLEHATRIEFIIDDGELYLYIESNKDTGIIYRGKLEVFYINYICEHKTKCVRSRPKLIKEFIPSVVVSCAPSIHLDDEDSQIIVIVVPLLVIPIVLLLLAILSYKVYRKYKSRDIVIDL